MREIKLIVCFFFVRSLSKNFDDKARVKKNERVGQFYQQKRCFFWNTRLLVDERERLADTFQKGGFLVFSLSLSRARRRRRSDGPKRPPSHTSRRMRRRRRRRFIDRPTERKGERKKTRDASSTGKKDRHGREGYNVLARKSCRIQKEYQKGLHRIVVSFLPAIEKEENTRSILLAPRCSSLAHLRRRRRRRRAALSLFLSVSKHFRQKRRSFKPSRRFVVDRKRRKREIFFFSNTYKTLNSTTSFFVVVVRV